MAIFNRFSVKPKPLLSPFFKKTDAPHHLAEPIDPQSFIQNCSPDSIKLLSFNVQVGIHTGSYHHYLTRSWQHLLPSSDRHYNLKQVADIVRHFDIVALQEVDGGSLRSGFVNQVRFLADQSHHGFWYQQRNRNLGVIAQHSNGVISREVPDLIEDHPLPGFIPGRGAILLTYGQGKDALMVVMLHLSLGKGAQKRQLGYIRELIGNHKRVVIMGDLNCQAEQLNEFGPLQDLALHPVEPSLTYPAWRPQKGLDHILVSDSIEIRQQAVLNNHVSDHLPVAVEIILH